MPERPILTFVDADEWSSWLAENHATVDGVRLKIGKKSCPDPAIAVGDALDVALCWGWIDAIRNALDENYFLQTYVPRRPKSIWSKVNVAKVEALIAEGRMQPPGFAEIERAKADGRWDAAYAGSATIEVPADLASALSPAARVAFDALSSQNRYAILFRLHHVKRAETRERNIADFVAMLERGETIYPQGGR